MKRLLATLLSMSVVSSAAFARDATARSVAREVRANSSVPLLLPQYVPYAGGHARYLSILAATKAMYRIAIALAPDCDDATACRLAHVTGERASRGRAPHGRTVRLGDGSRAIFSPAACSGAGCNDGTLRIVRGSFAYVVGVKGAADAAELVRMAESLRP